MGKRILVNLNHLNRTFSMVKVSACMRQNSGPLRAWGWSQWASGRPIQVSPKNSVSRSPDF